MRELVSARILKSIVVWQEGKKERVDYVKDFKSFKKHQF